MSSPSAVLPAKESNDDYTPANEKKFEAKEDNGELMRDSDMSSSTTNEPKFRVAHCQEMGRYLVAAKDLAKGEIIFQEFPIASGPERDSVLICPGCYEAPDDEMKVSPALLFFLVL